MISPFQGFSVLIEAKQVDERRKATLCTFYEDAEACLNCMDDKLRYLLEVNIRNLSEEITSNKCSLCQEEYIVLITGGL